MNLIEKAKELARDPEVRSAVKVGVVTCAATFVTAIALQLTVAAVKAGINAVSNSKS